MMLHSFQSHPKRYDCDCDYIWLKGVQEIWLVGSNSLIKSDKVFAIDFLCLSKAPDLKALV